MYNFYWYGKENAIKESFNFTNSVLVEDKESSKNWDNTENIYIEGNNLEVLKLLQKSYFNSIDCIYIDVPYNTGKDFVYRDNFKDNISNYKEVTNQLYKCNLETNGRYHTYWVNMIYPRLKICRNLLSSYGVIFISIDDYEMANLKKICDEVFGEDNFIGTFIQDKRNSQNDATNIQKNHEYILVYRKSPMIIDEKESPVLINKIIEKKKVIKELDDVFYYIDSGLVMGGGDGGTLSARPKLGYSIYYNPKTKDMIGIEDQSLEIAKISNNESEVYTSNKELIGKGYEIIRPPRNGHSLGRWKWSLEKFNDNRHLIQINKTKTGYSVYRKKYIDSRLVYREKDNYYVDLYKVSNTKSIIEFNSSSGTLTLKNTLGKKVFDNPKNLNMIEYIISLYYKQENMVVLDCFSGSATTAHAVMQLNSEDNKNRKYIMIQLPELTKETSEAYKAGYKNICEIGKERIRRAGDKIVSENKHKEGIEKLDIGFKVFKLKEENMFQKEILNKDSIKVEIIKRPKLKGLEKIKIDSETYYLFEDEEYYKIFNYSKGQSEVITSVFNKKECKNVSYMEMERVYTDVLVDFNEGWYHSNYVTVRILDEVYKKLQH